MVQIKMEIQCPKKETVGNVSMFKSLFIFILLVGNSCFAQNIEGKYSLKMGVDEGNRYFEFSNGKFSDTYHGHLESQKIGGGDYKVVDRNLILTYRKQIDKDTAIYNIEKQQISNTTKAHIFVKIFDNQKNAMAGFISLLNNSGNATATIITDIDGNCSLVIPEQNIKFLEIGFMGYSKVRIPLKNLGGFNSTINITLHPQTTSYMEPSQISYAIERLNSESISLYSKTKGKLELIKVKK